MNNKALVFVIGALNIVMIFLLVHKQNKIIKAQYELQHLQEQKQELLEQKKLLTLSYQQGQQLSSVQTFAQNNLQMSSLKLKDAHTIPQAQQQQATIQPEPITAQVKEAA